MIIKNFIPLALVAGIAAVSCNDTKTDGTTTTVKTDTMVNVSANPSSTPVNSTTVTDTANGVAPTATTTSSTTYRTGESRSVTVAELPKPVSAAFTKKYPKAENPTWMVYTPVEEDYMPGKTYYYVNVPGADGSDYVWYNESGDWYKTVKPMKKDSRLPDAVNKTINEQYPGYTIDEVSKENDKDMDMYEVKLLKGNEKAKLKILPDGSVFKRKEKTK